MLSLSCCAFHHVFRRWPEWIRSAPVLFAGPRQKKTCIRCFTGIRLSGCINVSRLPATLNRLTEQPAGSAVFLRPARWKKSRFFSRSVSRRGCSMQNNHLPKLSRPKGAPWHKGSVRVQRGLSGIPRYRNQRQIKNNNRAKAHSNGYFVSHEDPCSGCYPGECIGYNPCDGCTGGRS